MTLLRWIPYAEAAKDWPSAGKHILATYDDDSIVVYQAYRPSIAEFAVNHQKFGGEFSYGRMSWIKPNFLWMMYRSGWATKAGQERILAVRLPRPFFDLLLSKAIASTFDASRFTTRDVWQSAVASSDVRLQWDPDHNPWGTPLERRAVQLGLRGAALKGYGERELLGIEDITDTIVEQWRRVDEIGSFLVPAESVYTPAACAAEAVGIDRAF